MVGSRGKELAKNTLIISIGKIATQFITFLLLPVYTGILSTSEYGTVDLFNTIILLSIPLVSLQLEQAVFRKLVDHRGSATAKSEIISNAFISLTIQIAIFFAVYIILHFFFQNDYFWILAANIVATSFAAMFLQIARGLGDNLKYALASFLGSATTIIANLIFLLTFGWGINGIFIGTLIGQLIIICYLATTLKIPRYLAKNMRKSATIKELHRYSLPLVPNELSWWVFNASDRIIVSTILGLAANGILSAASKFPTAYIAVFNVFVLSWTESIILHIHDHDIAKFFNKTFNLVIKLFFIILILAISFMPYAFPLLVNQKFDESYNLIPILLIATFFNIIVGLLGAVYTAHKKTKEIAKTSVIAASTNIISHLLLIGFIGIFAAAFSTLISFFCLAIYRIKDIRKKYLKVTIPISDIIIMSLVLFITLIGYYIDILPFRIISHLTVITFGIKAFTELLHHKKS